MSPCIQQPDVALAVFGAISALVALVGYLVGYRRGNGAAPPRRRPAGRKR